MKPRLLRNAPGHAADTGEFAGRRTEVQAKHSTPREARAAGIGPVKAALLFIWLACGLADPGVAGEVQSYGFSKGQQMFVFDLGSGHMTLLNQTEFRAWARGQSLSSLTAASVQPPSGSALVLTPDDAGLSALATRDTVDQIESAYPAGNYTFSLSTSSGSTPSVIFALPSSAYPETPQLVDATTLNGVNAAAGFTLAWNPMSNPGPDKAVGVRITDLNDQVTFSTLPPGAPGALSAATTTLAIPASAWGSVAFGQTNAVNVEVIFYRLAVSDTLSVSGATGVCGFHTSARYLATVTTFPVEMPAITNYGLTLGALARQTNSLPAPLEVSGAAACCWARAADPSRVSGVSIIPPAAGAARPLVADAAQRAYELRQPFGSTAELTASTAFPAGSYALQVDEPDLCGFMVPVNFQAGVFPAFGFVENFAECQAVDPSADFQVKWTLPESGNGVFVHLTIISPKWGKVFETPALGDPACLTSSSLSATIPGGTLVEGQTYTCRLQVYREDALDSAALPGAFGHTGHFAETRFTLLTTGQAQSTLADLTIVGVVHLDPIGPGEEVLLEPAVINGSPPVAWNIASGQLPAGLNLSAATGQIHGYPQAAGDYAFELQASDAAQRSAKTAITLSVTGSPPPLLLSAASLPAAVNGGYYSQALPYTGGIPPLQWSIQNGGRLPGGLTIDDVGVIHGDPTESGTFTFTVQVTDAIGQQASQAFQFTVPPLIPVAIESIYSFAALPDGRLKLQASGTADAAYTIERSSDLKSWQAVATPPDLVHVPEILPAPLGAPGFYRLQVAPSTAPIQTWNVQATPDSARALKECVKTNGAILTVTDAQGALYTLTIPPNALPSTRQITMSPIASITDAQGRTVSGGGVILEPEGTRFRLPAILTIDSPQPLTNALLYSGSGSGVDLHPVIASMAGNRITAPVLHFTVFRYESEGTPSPGISCDDEAAAAYQLWKFEQLPPGQRNFLDLAKIYQDYLKAVIRYRIEPAQRDETYVNDALGALAQWLQDANTGDAAAARLIGTGLPRLQEVLSADLALAREQMTVALGSAVVRTSDRCSRASGPVQGFKVRYYAETANDAFDLGLANQLDQDMVGRIVQRCLQLRWSFYSVASSQCRSSSCGTINQADASIATPRKGRLTYSFTSKEWIDDDSTSAWGWVCAVPDDLGVTFGPAQGAVALNTSRFSHLPSLIMKQSPLQPKLVTTPRGCQRTDFEFGLQSVRGLFAPRGAFDVLLPNNIEDEFYVAPMDTVLMQSGYGQGFDARTSTAGWILNKISGPDDSEGWWLRDYSTGSPPDGGDGNFAGYSVCKVLRSGTDYAAYALQLSLYYDPGRRRPGNPL